LLDRRRGVTFAEQGIAQREPQQRSIARAAALLAQVVEQVVHSCSLTAVFDSASRRPCTPGSAVPVPAGYGPREGRPATSLARSLPRTSGMAAPAGRNAGRPGSVFPGAPRPGRPD